jgi:hypothetical protein
MFGIYIMLTFLKQRCLWMIILVLLTLIRFYKLLRFVNVCIIDLYVDVENTAHCVHLSLSAVHWSHAYVFDSALSLFCIEMATSFESLYVKNVITVCSSTILLDLCSFYEYHHLVYWWTCTHKWLIYGGYQSVTSLYCLEKDVKF